MYGQYVEFLSRSGFMSQDYHYKLIVTQIPHDVVGTDPFLLGNEPRTAACRAVTLPLQKSGGNEF